MLNRLKDLPWAFITGLLLSYSTITGCLWHLGYWSTFKFNFLEFANIGDLFKASIYPFFSKIWLFIAINFITIGPCINWAIHEFNRRRLPRNQFFSTKIHSRYIGLLIALSSIFSFIYSGALFRNGSMWNVLPFSISLFLACLAFLFGILKDKIKDDFFRLNAWFLFFIYPCLNYSIAKKKSIETLCMFRYQQVTEVITTDTLIKKTIINTAYIGNTGKFYFFFTPTKVTIIYVEKIEALTLQEKIDDRNFLLWQKY